EKRRHTVKIARNGKEVLEFLSQELFDIILMDVQMPEMDGFAATAAVREREKETGQHVPIIAITAHAMKGDEDRCRRAGMDAYIPKPIDSHELLMAMAALARDLPPARTTTPASYGELI